MYGGICMEAIVEGVSCITTFGLSSSVVDFVRQLLLSHDKNLHDLAKTRALQQAKSLLAMQEKFIDELQLRQQVAQIEYEINGRFQDSVSALSLHDRSEMSPS